MNPAGAGPRERGCDLLAAAAMAMAGGGGDADADADDESNRDD